MSSKPRHEPTDGTQSLRNKLLYGILSANQIPATGECRRGQWETDIFGDAFVMFRRKCGEVLDGSAGQRQINSLAKLPGDASMHQKNHAQRERLRGRIVVNIACAC